MTSTHIEPRMSTHTVQFHAPTQMQFSHFQPGDRPTSIIAHPQNPCTHLPVHSTTGSLGYFPDPWSKAFFVPFLKKGTR